MQGRAVGRASLVPSRTLAQPQMIQRNHLFGASSPKGAADSYPTSGASANDPPKEIGAATNDEGGAPAIVPKMHSLTKNFIYYIIRSCSRFVNFIDD